MLVGGVILISSAIYVTFIVNWGHVSFEGLTSANIAERLFGFLVIALALERATEVLVLAIFGKEKTSLKNKAKLYSVRISNKKEALNIALAAGVQSSSGVVETQQAIDEILTDPAGLGKLQKDSEALKRRIQIYTLIFGLIIGGLLSLAGLRFIESLLESGFNPVDGTLGAGLDASMAESIGNQVATTTKEELDASLKASKITELQIAWLSIIDIFVSTLLLAGGADGIHKIISAATNAASDDVVPT